MKSNNMSFPNCWVCNDTGFILLVRKINGIDYDMAIRCKCKVGQITSDRVKTISDDMAEKKAAENFSSFRERHPEVIFE